MESRFVGKKRLPYYLYDQREIELVRIESILDAGDTARHLLSEDVASKVLFENRWLKRKVTEERLLVIELLHEAIDSYKRHMFSRKPKDRMLFKEADDWIFGMIECDTPFSFEDACEIAGISVSAARRALTNWREAAKAERKSMQKKL